MIFLKLFLSFYSAFKWETSANTHESEQQGSVDQEIETEIKFFSANLSVEVLSWWNSNKNKKIHILPGLKEDFFRHHHLFIQKSDFQKLVRCKSKIDCFQKPMKNFYFFIIT